MKTLTTLVYFFLISFFTSAQTNEETASKTIAAGHTMLAILPPHVNVQLLKEQKRKVDSAEIRQAEQDLSFMMQAYIFEYFEKKSDKYNYTVNFQRRLRTNNLLFSKGMSYDQYLASPADSLFTMLADADAVFITTATISKLMDDNVHHVISVLRMGLFPGNNRIGMRFEIADRATGKIIWTHEYLPEDNTSSSIEGCLNIIMRKAAKVIPYRK